MLAKPANIATRLLATLEPGITLVKTTTMGSVNRDALFRFESRVPMVPRSLPQSD